MSFLLCGEVSEIINLRSPLQKSNWGRKNMNIVSLVNFECVVVNYFIVTNIRGVVMIALLELCFTKII